MKTLLISACFLFCSVSFAQQTAQVPSAATTNEAPPAADVLTGGSESESTLSSPATKTENKKADKALEPIKKDLQDRGESRREESEEKVPEVGTGPFELKSRIGLHFGVGIPHPVTLGLDYLSPNRNYGFSLIGGSSKGDAEDIHLEVSNVEMQVHIHPWSTAFYVGLGAGNHVVKAQRSQEVMGQVVTADASVKASYLSPQLGWIALWPSGFNLGFQAGVLIPTGSAAEVSSDAPAIVKATPEYRTLAANVKDKSEQYGKVSLPYVTLLRLGWLF